MHEKASTAAFRWCLFCPDTDFCSAPFLRLAGFSVFRGRCRLLARADPRRGETAGGPLAASARSLDSQRVVPHRARTSWYPTRTVEAATSFRRRHQRWPVWHRCRLLDVRRCRYGDGWSPNQFPRYGIVSSGRYFQGRDAPLVAAANTFRSRRAKSPLEFRRITRPCRHGGHFASSSGRQPIGDIDLRRDGSIAWGTSGGCAASVSATEAYTIDLSRTVDVRPASGGRLKAIVLRWGEQGESRYAGVVQPTRHDWLSRQRAGGTLTS